MLAYPAASCGEWLAGGFKSIPIMAPYIRTFFPRKENAETPDSRAGRFTMYPREMGIALGSDSRDNHWKIIDKPGMKCEIYTWHGTERARYKVIAEPKWKRHGFRSPVVEERIVGA
jgi:hypothetical protein